MSQDIYNLAREELWDAVNVIARSVNTEIIVPSSGIAGSQSIVLIILTHSDVFETITVFLE